MFVEYLSEAMS